MHIQTHQIEHLQIAEVTSDERIISGSEDGLDLLGNLYYQGFDGVILYEENIAADFFNLKTGMAGEVLQKFSNYRMRLVIIGDFEMYDSQSLRQFIVESNKGKQVNFVDNLHEALQRLQ